MPLAVRTRLRPGRFPFPVVPDDGNTVAHVYFNGAGIIDRFGNAWTQNGTVPQVARSGRTPPGAGPFSDANYYSLGSGSDVLDFAGDFSVCGVVSLGASMPSISVPFSDGDSLTSGWWYDFGYSTGGTAAFGSAGLNSIVPAPNARVLNAVNVVCMGRAGATGYAKLNLGALATSSAGAITPATSKAALIGKLTPYPFSSSSLLEFWASTTTPTDALFTAIMTRVKSRLGITAW